MQRFFLIPTILIFTASLASAQGVLVPDDATVPPLAMTKEKINIAIEDQVAVTTIDQTFRNTTDHALEATYVFPVPRGATVNKFAMWVDGKEAKGELIDAAKARDLYTSIIKRSHNPALLEYLDNQMLKVRVTSVPAKAEQRITVSYTALAGREADVIEYTYPLRTEARNIAALQEFTLTGTIKGQHGIHNAYSPTHALAIKRISDREVTVALDKSQGLLDKDFRLFYSLGDADVGLTALTHRMVKDENGYFMFLVSPKVEMAKDNVIARDVVMVLDTSGSMRGIKLEQAKKALKFCLNNLGPRDRFGMIEFAAAVRKYRNDLTDSSKDEVEKAKQWVDRLQATGGTNINDALLSALAMRSKDAGRTFTMVFFTDGLPTSSERDPNKIIKNVMEKNLEGTRIFSFGVGNDVNATFLDRLALETRAISTYVRPQEDIEEKVSTLYSKISNPVLANLKLGVGPDVQLEEVYPPQLPDLFEGGQLVVLGRYRGKGPAEIKLTGTVGKEKKEFTYKVNFAGQTKEDKEFVENLWASRKIGYLLDQIRANGPKKELVDEVTTLAKKYGIATPYTSYLVVTDAPLAAKGDPQGGYGAGPAGLAPTAPGAAQQKVADFAKQAQSKPGELAANRGAFEDRKLQNIPADGKGADKDAVRALAEAKEKKEAYDKAREMLFRNNQNGVQAGKLGVDLSIQNNNLRNQCRLEQSAVRKVAGRNCLEIGGVWIDEGYDSKMPTVTVKAQSDAYFALLAKHPEVRDVLKLGNHLVWVTPSGTALVIDTNDGKDKLTDAEIEALFVAKSK